MFVHGGFVSQISLVGSSVALRAADAGGDYCKQFNKHFDSPGADLTFPEVWDVQL